MDIKALFKKCITEYSSHLIELC